MALPSAGHAAAVLPVGCGVIDRRTIAQLPRNRVAKMRHICDNLALSIVFAEKIGIMSHEAG
ncbi:hypothetical protein FJ987_17020 [Mesorhizobium sp. CU2]|uniref:hypothetical protein n=1 Tax=unclassified Mesorhizobium TaxID=325217 RepID=UPI00112D6D43|nr:MULTISPECIES: hypothetical protein [unclassified Mesorhizobium]TPN81986.1 hypothetical protein FJ988_17510 [Mesorhizobium sp. CU3]TPO12423.1 hypothetical protein FJ987_17020 [Mesorhizobium sp. CU2]